MDFKEEANRLLAEQFLEEKAAAAAPKVSALAEVQLLRASSVEDLDLLKIASAFCPTDPLAFYLRGLSGGVK